jgi:hypothetical protein
MPRYKFTGHGPEVFVELSGVLAPVLGDAVLEPGDVIDLPDPVDHPRLEPTDEPATVRDPEPEPEPDDPEPDAAELVTSAAPEES